MVVKKLSLWPVHTWFVLVGVRVFQVCGCDAWPTAPPAVGLFLFGVHCAFLDGVPSSLSCAHVLVPPCARPAALAGLCAYSEFWAFYPMWPYELWLQGPERACAAVGSALLRQGSSRLVHAASFSHCWCRLPAHHDFDVLWGFLMLGVADFHRERSSCTVESQPAAYRYRLLSRWLRTQS